MEENGRIETGQMWCDTRKRFGLSQKQAAELSGVSAKTVSRLENGAVNVQAFNKMKLAEAYGSSVAEIEGGLSQAQYEDIHEYISALVRIQDYKRYSDSFLLLGMILLILDLFVLAFACIAYKEGNIAICAEYILLTAVCLLASVMCFITSFTSGRRARKNEKPVRNLCKNLTSTNVESRVMSRVARLVSLCAGRTRVRSVPPCTIGTEVRNTPHWYAQRMEAVRAPCAPSRAVDLPNDQRRDLFGPRFLFLGTRMAPGYGTTASEAYLGKDFVIRIKKFHR